MKKLIAGLLIGFFIAIIAGCGPQKVEAVNGTSIPNNTGVKYKGKITSSSNMLLKATDDYFALARILDKLIVYSHMKFDEDKGVSESESLMGIVDKFADEVSEKLAFYTPEVLSADYDKIKEDDVIDVLGLTSFAPGVQLTIVLNHADGSKEEFKVNHSYNAQQIEWFKAGAALNIIRSQVAGN